MTRGAITGVAVVAGVGALATALGTGVTGAASPAPVSPLLWGLALGTLAGALAGERPAWTPGIRFVSRTVLRGAIVLLGLRLGWDQLGRVGGPALAVVFGASGLTFAFTLWLGRRLGLPRNRVLLVASGTCVCGAAAIAAVDGVLASDEQDVALALGAVTLFGTLALVLDPLVWHLGLLSTRTYALWTGASIHEVAQVTAAAAVLPGPGQALASTVKLLRVLLLVPLTLALSALPRPGARAPGRPRVAVPWFALGFFALSALASTPFLSTPAWAGPRDALGALDGFLLTAALAALGWEIRWDRFRGLDRRTLWLGLAPTLVINGLALGLALALG